MMYYIASWGGGGNVIKPKLPSTYIDTWDVNTIILESNQYNTTVLYRKWINNSYMGLLMLVVVQYMEYNLHRMQGHRFTFRYVYCNCFTSMQLGG